MLCGGNITLVHSSVHRMSMWFARHCLWESADGQLGASLATSLDGHRMSVRFRRHCGKKTFE